MSRDSYRKLLYYFSEVASDFFSSIVKSQLDNVVSASRDFIVNELSKAVRVIMSTNEKLLPLTYKPSSTAPISSPGQSDAPKFVPPVAAHWPSTNFVLAAGTATFQPSTAKVVLIEDTARRPPNKPRENWYWFLPRGRKDRGETLEQCAVRETFEEAGYAATLLRSPIPTLQPRITEAEKFHSEAFHIQLLPYLRPHRPMPTHISGLELYLAFWYICTIPYGATRDEGYGEHFVGAHEKGYSSELVDVAEAVRLLSGGDFEYRHTGMSSGGGVQGGLVERKTGREINWGDLGGGDAGGVEALVVAMGWEWIRATSIPVQEMMTRLEV